MTILMKAAVVREFGEPLVIEELPVIVGIVLLTSTRERFPLTSLVYGLLAAHAVVLCLGGHYTYAEVPLGYWVQEAFGFSRNHYDRLGHFFQGFVPAVLAREILLRRSPLQRGKWLFFIVTSICLAFSALYELIEWWTALATGESAEAFLGTWLRAGKHSQDAVTVGSKWGYSYVGSWRMDAACAILKRLTDAETRNVSDHLTGRE